MKGIPFLIGGLIVGLVLALASSAASTTTVTITDTNGAAHGTAVCAVFPSTGLQCSPVIAGAAVTDIAQDESANGFGGPWVAKVYNSATVVSVAVTGMKDAGSCCTAGAVSELTTGGYVGAPPHPFHVKVSGKGTTVTVRVERAVR